MNSDAEKFWDEVSDKLRRFKGLRPLTLKEAEAELNRAPEDPLTSGQIDSIVEAVTSGELASWEPSPTLDWTNEFNADEVNDEVLQLNRNRGDDDPDTDQLEEELRQELSAMMKPKKTRMEWLAEQCRRELAGKQADEIVRQLCLTAPIDPVAVAKSEHPLLRIGGRDFHDRFDGQLEYHASKNRFLLFYNTKYDADRHSGTHHPRTRFSIAHELGHYFIERHRAYLMRGGKPHHSTTEFRSSQEIEREADAFAASLLMPSQLIKPLVNQGELSFSRIENIAGKFETSIMSTTIRAVRLSHFPCAVAGIQDGKRAWMFVSDSLIEAGLYPGAAEVLSSAAREQWESFRLGVPVEKPVEGNVRDWFQTFDRNDLDDLFLTQEFVAVPVMDTLLVLLAVDEDDLVAEDAEDDEDE